MISLRQGLGLAIAKRRKAVGVAQEEFAFHAKVHRTYMTGIERGRQNPSLDVIERIAAALKCEVSELIAEAERERKRSRRS
ncbi:MAG: helix-turn-helix domain-containing protein [Gemmatimonadaceae bacterium]